MRGKGRAQVENGVADQLARAVEGDVTAAVCFIDGDAALGEGFVRGDDVFAMRVAAQREQRLVLEQEQRVADALLFAQLDEHLLQFERGRIIDLAELKE